MAVPAVFFGATTSVDIVKQRQNVTLTVLHGEKRSHDQTCLKSPHAAIFKDITNDVNARDGAKRLRAHNLPKNCIEASRICTVGQDEESFSESRDFGKSLALAPGSSQNPLLSLDHLRYGLPEELVKNFEGLGIRSIYSWQSSCLLGRGMLDGQRNLVYSAPTGCGKSLVADILMLKRVIEDPPAKAILVLPYVALVQEKLKWLRRVVDGVPKRLYESSQFGSQVPSWRKVHSNAVRVVGLFGGSKVTASWSDFDIAVCTIEKANGLINTAIEKSSIKDLAVLVMDELHMVTDNHRGYLMELIASKVLSLEHQVQLIGMSATLNNTELLAKWLNAKYYSTTYAPVPIREFLVCDRAIYVTSTSSAFYRTASQLNSTQPLLGVSVYRQIQKSDHPELKNPIVDAVVALAIETASAGFGALVFCSSRQGCQNTASLIANAMSDEVTDIVLEQRKDAVNELRSLPLPLDETLEMTIPRGVAFHHAGLTAEERDIVAAAYDAGVIKVIVATCSLAAGINLPARRVILHGARMGRDFIGPAMLRQMRGRAGRKGKDDVGESFLCCETADLEEVVQLLEADLPAVESSLTPEKRGLKRKVRAHSSVDLLLMFNRALLEVITIRLATHMPAIEEYVSHTLLYHTMNRTHFNELLNITLFELSGSGLLVIDRFGGYDATRLSVAIVASYLTPEDGIFLQEELQTALKAFVMDGEMHIFYTFTPVTISGPTEIDWVIFRNEVERLDESGLRVLDFVGISPAFVIRMANSAKILPETTPAEIRSSRIYRRFYNALQLRDLCNEVPVHAVARKYHVSRGSVQNLIQVCEGFAAGLIQFCDKMGWGMLKAALEHMFDRLKAGARADLLELAKIPFVKSRTARVFWEHGLRGVARVAEAEAKELIPILLTAQPRKTRINEEDEVKYQQKLLLKAEIIINSANRIWEREQQQQRIDIEADM